MAEFLWKKLKTLASFDRELSLNQEKKTTLLKKVEIEKVELTKIKIHITELKQDALLKQKQVDTLELDAASLNIEELKKKTAIETSTTKKELIALRHELSILETRRKDIEDSLISAWHQLELAEKALTSAKENQDALLATHTKIIHDCTSEIEALTSKTMLLLTQEKNLLDTIPEEWIKKYQNMKERVTDPIIPAIDESCSSCYYLVLPGDIARLKKGAILSCRSCYRLLYYDSDEEKSAHTAQY